MRSWVRPQHVFLEETQSNSQSSPVLSSPSHLAPAVGLGDKSVLLAPICLLEDGVRHNTGCLEGAEPGFGAGGSQEQ
jgi:hypothetical protein